MPKPVSEVSPAYAFRVYVEMGDKRSIAGLEKRLKAKGTAPARATLMRWQKKYRWEEAVADGDELAAEAHAVAIEAADVVAAIDPDDAIPFTVVETFEGTANALHTMTAAMASVVTATMQRVLDRGERLDLDDALSVARVIRELGNTTADMHRALNPPVGKGKQEQSAVRDANTGLLVGAPVLGGPPSVDELIEAFANPPMSR